jgi:hypothetical protein
MGEEAAMDIFRQLDNPFKRLSFVLTVTGLSVLAVSLIVWTQQSRHNRIYYSEHHYGWVPADSATFGDTYWSVDSSCALPFLEQDAADAEQQLVAHRAAEPEKPRSNPPSSLKELQRHDEMYKRYSEWSSKRWRLEYDAKKAKDTISNIKYWGTRAGEVAETVRRNDSVSGLFSPDIESERDTRTEEDKFHAALLSNLGLTSLSPDLREQVFRECVMESKVRYMKLKTTHHSKLDDWPDDHPLPFWLGLGLTVSGLLGSFAYGFSASVFRATVEKLLSWIKTGTSQTPGNPGAVVAKGAPQSTNFRIVMIYTLIIGTPFALIWLAMQLHN